MQNPGPFSGWYGRVRRLGLSFGLLSSLAACALNPLGMGNPRAADELQFLDRAMNAPPGAREAMWKEAVAARRTEDGALRTALMESVPDHSGYDPTAAQHDLRAVLANNAPDDIAALVRVRLDELKFSSRCLGEAQELRKRMAQVVDIERRMDDRGRAKP